MLLDRSSALDSPHSITKTIFRRAVHPCQAVPTLLLFLLSLPNPTTSKKILSSLPLPLPPICFLSDLHPGMLPAASFSSDRKWNKKTQIQSSCNSLFFLTLNSFKHLSCYQSIPVALYIYHNFILCLHCYCNYTSFPSSALLFLVIGLPFGWSHGHGLVVMWPPVFLKHVIGTGTQIKGEGKYPSFCLTHTLPKKMPAMNVQTTWTVCCQDWQILRCTQHFLLHSSCRTSIKAHLQ